MKARMTQWLPGGVLLAPAALLEALGDLGEDLVWEVKDGHEELELSGGEGTGYVDLDAWYAERRRVRTAALVEKLAQGYGTQLIWGMLLAYPSDGSTWCLSIQGFDSTWYEIDGREDLVSRLTSAYEGATVPSGTEEYDHD